MVRSKGQKPDTLRVDLRVPLAPVTPTGFAPVTEERLREMAERIAAALTPDQIILFGSYAYGTPSPDSDVDLLVIMKTRARPAERIAAVSRLLSPRQFPLDIVVRTPGELQRALHHADPFMREVMERGRVLYARP